MAPQATEPATPQPLCLGRGGRCSQPSPTPRSPRRDTLFGQPCAPGIEPPSQLSRTAVTPVGHPGIEPSAGGAGQQHQNSPQAKQHRWPKQATSRVGPGCPRPSRTGCPALPPPPRPSMGNCADACEGHPTLAPNTEGAKSPRLPGGKGQHRASVCAGAQARQLRTDTNKQTTLCQPLSPLRRGVVYRQVNRGRD